MLERIDFIKQYSINISRTLIINGLIYCNAAMREMTVLLSINEHHLFIGVRLHLPFAKRIGIARDVSPRDATGFPRAAGAFIPESRINPGAAI